MSARDMARALAHYQAIGERREADKAEERVTDAELREAAQDEQRPMSQAMAAELLEAREREARLLAPIDVEAEVEQAAQGAYRARQEYRGDFSWPWEKLTPFERSVWHSTVRPGLTREARLRRELAAAEERAAKLDAVKVADVEALLDKHRAAFGVAPPQAPGEGDVASDAWDELPVAAGDDLARLLPNGVAAIGLSGNRDHLGRMVRDIWIEWAREQPSPKASWLVPWEGLSEPDREVDRRIGERLAAMDARRPTLTREQADLWAEHIIDRTIGEDGSEDPESEIATALMAAARGETEPT